MHFATGMEVTTAEATEVTAEATDPRPVYAHVHANDAMPPPSRSQRYDAHVHASLQDSVQDSVQDNVHNVHDMHNMQQHNMQQHNLHDVHSVHNMHNLQQHHVQNVHPHHVHQQHYLSAHAAQVDLPEPAALDAMHAISQAQAQPYIPKLKPKARKRPEDEMDSHMHHVRPHPTTCERTARSPCHPFSVLSRPSFASCTRSGCTARRSR